MNDNVDPTPTDLLGRVCALLDRGTNIAALQSLSRAMRYEPANAPLSETVIAFDANVFLRLSGHAKCEDIVDYLRTSFEGRLILPGQVIQEFWNNQYSVVATVSASVKRKFDELESAISNLDERFEDFSSRFSTLLQEFNSSFGYVFDDNATRKSRLVVDLLQEKASVPFVPRTSLVETAMARKRSRTPPGFKDDLDGDFYVWADLLLGLAEFNEQGTVIGRVTLVTLDKKVDWSREGVPHPILAAEIKAVCGADFETVTVETSARRLLD